MLAQGMGCCSCTSRPHLQRLVLLRSCALNSRQYCWQPSFSSCGQLQVHRVVRRLIFCSWPCSCRINTRLHRRIIRLMRSKKPRKRIEVIYQAVQHHDGPVSRSWPVLRTPAATVNKLASARAPQALHLARKHGSAVLHYLMRLYESCRIKASVHCGICCGSGRIVGPPREPKRRLGLRNTLALPANVAR